MKLMMALILMMTSISQAGVVTLGVEQISYEADPNEVTIHTVDGQAYPSSLEFFLDYNRHSEKVTPKVVYVVKKPYGVFFKIERPLSSDSIDPDTLRETVEKAKEGYESLVGSLENAFMRRTKNYQGEKIQTANMVLEVLKTGEPVDAKEYYQTSTPQSEWPIDRVWDAMFTTMAPWFDKTPEEFTRWFVTTYHAVDMEAKERSLWDMVKEKMGGGQ